MSESAPVFEKHELELPVGGQHEIAAHTEHAPTPEEVASEKQHMSQESRATITQEAPSHNPVEAFQAQQAAATAVAPIRESRKVVGQRQLAQVQRKLPARQRQLSKVIHQPVVRMVSESAASTITRPSGLLGGGLVALIGTSGYLYMAKHIGFNYNYLVFILLFVGGFGLGLALELVVWSLTAARRRTE